MDLRNGDGSNREKKRSNEHQEENYRNGDGTGRPPREPGYHRPRGRSATPLFLWMSVILAIAFLPVALYIPLLILNMGNSGRASITQLICSADVGTSGELREMVILGPVHPKSNPGAYAAGAGLRPEGGSASVRIIVAMTDSVYRELWRARSLPGKTGVDPSGAFVLTVDEEAIGLEASSLAGCPIPWDRLKNAMPGLKGPLGEVVNLDPLCLTARADDLADKGLPPIKADPDWTEVKVILKKTGKPLGLEDPIGTFSALLHQNSGRLCDSDGMPTFHMSEGNRAASLLKELSSPTMEVTDMAGLPLGIMGLGKARELAKAKVGRNDVTVFPFPQSPGGRTAYGVRRVVLTCFDPRRIGYASGVSFNRLAEGLTESYGYKDVSRYQGRENTPEELFYGKRHRSALVSALQAVMAGDGNSGSATHSALVRAARENTGFDEQNPLPFSR